MLFMPFLKAYPASIPIRAMPASTWLVLRSIRLPMPKKKRAMMWLTLMFI